MFAILYTYISKVLNVQWFSYRFYLILDQRWIVSLSNRAKVPFQSEMLNTKTIKLVHEMNRKLMCVWCNEIPRYSHLETFDNDIDWHEYRYRQTIRRHNRLIKWMWSNNKRTTFTLFAYIYTEHNESESQPRVRTREFK